MTTAIAERFDAAVIAATDQPGQPDLSAAQPGELWVSKDLAAVRHPLDEWIHDRHGELRPLLAVDWTGVEATATGHRLRCYRQLSRTWYAWLYWATCRARSQLEQQHPNIWQQMATRFNGLWSVARRWWPADLAALHDGSWLSAAYRPPQPDYLTARRWSTDQQ